MNRRDKINYYLDIAEQVSKRCTCLRRHYGAVIVKDDELISTGYVGAPRGRKNCTDMQTCVREEKGIARGERYELCRSVHAEANAIISASRKDMLGSAMYLAGTDVRTGNYVENASSCAMCKRLIINAGISMVYIRNDKDNYQIVNVLHDWIEQDDSLAGTFGY
ncbi:MAG: deaminase [Oscillospiraceae bacterium]|nr:deaminase [Oscillospiraceae bacterium]